MSIATSIAGQVSSRDLDKLQELEESLNIKEHTPLQVLTDDKGTEEDKVRYLLFLILRDIIKLQEVDKYKEELTKQERTNYIKAIDYIKKIKNLSSATATIDNSSSQEKGMFSKFVNTSAYVMEGVKNLTTGTRKLPVARLVDQIIDQKDTGGTNVGYWDPKMSNANTVARSKAPVTDAIVFMVGGGCYNEYLEVAAKNERK